MPATQRRIPKYRHDKPKNLGVVRLNGKDVYLGKYDSPESPANRRVADARWHFPAPASDRMAAKCREFDVFTIFGMLEADGDDMFNACVLVGPDGLVGSYRKIHLPFLGADRFATSANRPFEVFAAGKTRVSMNICNDGSFPELISAKLSEGVFLRLDGTVI